MTSAYLVGQWGIGYFFNDWLMSTGYVVPLFILGILALSAITAIARDHVNAAGLGEDVGETVPAFTSF